MYKIISLISCLLLVASCTSPQHHAIPVEEAGSPLRHAGSAVQTKQATGVPQDNGVIVMVPKDATATPIESMPLITTSEQSLPIQATPPSPQKISDTTLSVPMSVHSSMPSGIPTQASDVQLDGAVLALLSSAQQQQASGDLNGAASSLERAQRIAPREPQVLYQLAQVRLAQGDSAQAEQLARRALTYTSGASTLQTNLWTLIGKAKQAQGTP